MNTSDKILAREVIKEKTDDGKDTLKIIVRSPRLGGGKEALHQKIGLLIRHDRLDRSDRFLQPVRPLW